MNARTKGRPAKHERERVLGFLRALRRRVGELEDVVRDPRASGADLAKAVREVERLWKDVTGSEGNTYALESLIISVIAGSEIRSRTKPTVTDDAVASVAREVFAAEWPELAPKLNQADLIEAILLWPRSRGRSVEGGRSKWTAICRLAYQAGLVLRVDKSQADALSVMWRDRHRTR